MSKCYGEIRKGKPYGLRENNLVIVTKYYYSNTKYTSNISNNFNKKEWERENRIQRKPVMDGTVVLHPQNNI